MPRTPPPNVTRSITCPDCRVERTTRAHPNVLVKCPGCGGKYRVYSDDSGGAAPTAPPATAEDGGEPADSDDTGLQEPSPSPHPQPEISDDHSRDFVDIEGVVTFPAAEPPPVGEPPTPEPVEPDATTDSTAVEDDATADPPLVEPRPGRGGRRWRK